MNEKDEFSEDDIIITHAWASPYLPGPNRDPVRAVMARYDYKGANQGVVLLFTYFPCEGEVDCKELVGMSIRGAREGRHKAVNLNTGSGLPQGFALGI